MSRTMATMLAAALCAAALPARAEDPQVNLYAWSGYVSAAVAKDFNKATGIKVITDTYASKAEADAKLAAGASGYDLVVMTAAPYLETEIKAGAYQKLDRSQLPNLAAQDPAIARLLGIADPGLTILGLPLMNGYYTIFDGEADHGRGVIRFAPSRR